MKEKEDILFDDVFDENKPVEVSQDLIMAYLEGKLTHQQQHQVEEWLSDESMESDAIEGLKKMDANETKRITQKLNHKLEKLISRKKRKPKQLKLDLFIIVVIVTILILAILAYFGVSYKK